MTHHIKHEIVDVLPSNLLHDRLHQRLNELRPPRLQSNVAVEDELQQVLLHVHFLGVEDGVPQVDQRLRHLGRLALAHQLRLVSGQDENDRTGQLGHAGVVVENVQLQVQQAFLLFFGRLLRLASDHRL